MTQEEKAKAYDKAIEKFDVILNLNTVKESGTIFADDVRKIFPELKESEDEKIRKALIKYYSFDKDGGSHALDNITPEQIVTWLEKQGEQNLVLSEEDNNMLKWVIAYLNNRMLNTPISEERTACKNAIAWLEKKGELIRDTDTVDSNEDGLIAETIQYKNENQGEQKSADKVETKFHEGDWITIKE